MSGTYALLCCSQALVKSEHTKSHSSLVAISSVNKKISWHPYFSQLSSPFLYFQFSCISLSPHSSLFSSSSSTKLTRPNRYFSIVADSEPKIFHAAGNVQLFQFLLRPPIVDIPRTGPFFRPFEVNTYGIEFSLPPIFKGVKMIGVIG